jgi:hypothetical protein
MCSRAGDETWLVTGSRIAPQRLTPSTAVRSIARRVPGVYIAIHWRRHIQPPQARARAMEVRAVGEVLAVVHWVLRTWAFADPQWIPCRPPILVLARCRVSYDGMVRRASVSSCAREPETYTWNDNSNRNCPRGDDQRKNTSHTYRPLLRLTLGKDGLGAHLRTRLRYQGHGRTTRGRQTADS